MSKRETLKFIVQMIASIATAIVLSGNTEACTHIRTVVPICQFRKIFPSKSLTFFFPFVRKLLRLPKSIINELVYGLL